MKRWPTATVGVAVFFLILISYQEFVFSQETGKGDGKDDPPRKCNCEAVTCEPVTPDKCPHDIVPDTQDPCRCCMRCGNSEYEFCDPDDMPDEELAEKTYNFGLCGKGLTCRSNDGVPAGGKPEMICYCQDERMVCGSDGVTYETECRMTKVGFEQGRNVTKKARGMCKRAPKVVTPPIDVTNSTTGNVYLQCEVIGNPVPRVEWRKIGPSGNDIFLPSGGSGYERFTVQTRGGPEEYEVTGWLQISKLEIADGGEYECVGINKFGKDSEKARIIVE